MWWFKSKCNIYSRIMYTIELFKRVSAQRSYDNVRWFTSLDSQESYFSSLDSKKIENCTPILNENMFLCDGNVEDFREYSYMRFYFTENGQSKKKVYCFINKVQYKNDDCFILYYSIDAFQTYMLNLNIGKVFVEREHPLSNLPYHKYQDEGFGIGYHIDGQSKNMMETGLDDVIIVGSTKSLDDGETDVTSGFYNGVYRGYKLYAYNGVLQLDVAMNRLIEKGNQDAIIEMYMTAGVLGQYGESSHEVTTSSSAYTHETTIDLPDSIDGYTPENKCLLQYPYVIVEVSNGTGQKIELQPELFDGTPTFNLRGVINDGVQFIAEPTNYQDSENTKRLSINQYPKLSWSNDPYATWLAQNNYSTFTNMLVPIGIGAITGGVGGAALGAIGSALSTVATGLDLKDKPTTIGGAANGAVVIKPSAVVRIKTITSEKAKALDDFLTKFGWKTNRFKIPNMTSRSDFNFVKTSDCDFTGNIPHEYLDDINSAFDKGINLWHTNF